MAADTVHSMLNLWQLFLHPTHKTIRATMKIQLAFGAAQLHLTEIRTSCRFVQETLQPDATSTSEVEMASPEVTGSSLLKRLTACARNRLSRRC